MGLFAVGEENAPREAVDAPTLAAVAEATGGNSLSRPLDRRSRSGRRGDRRHGAQHA
jgi:hypothetical protein